MGPAPWWVTLLVGALTVTGAVAGAFYAARTGAKQTRQATDQREMAAAREEWFRRVQWANELVSRRDPAQRAIGLSVLGGLANSALAGPDDLRLIRSLNVTNPKLNELEGDYGDDVDDTEFFADDEDQVIDPEEDSK